MQQVICWFHARFLRKFFTIFVVFLLLYCAYVCKIKIKFVVPVEKLIKEIVETAFSTLETLEVCVLLVGLSRFFGEEV